MTAEELKVYLDTRRADWPYGDSYRVEHLTDHRYVAKADGELAGLSYAETSEDGLVARMKMNLKAKYAEFGIGTELLFLLMEDLKSAGFEIIRYEISPERYAFQIYKNLGFSVENQDEDAVRFIWKRNP